MASLALAMVVPQTALGQAADQTGSWERPFLEYEVNKVDPWGPFALNLLGGFGLGSFVQGDTTTGVVLALADFVGAGLLLAGAFHQPDCAEMINDECVRDGTNLLTLSGLAVAGLGRIIGMAAPFVHANAVNDQLRQDLGISVSEVSLSEQGLAVTFAVE